jgi:hypothetical protein
MIEKKEPRTSLLCQTGYAPPAAGKPVLLQIKNQVPQALKGYW